MALIGEYDVDGEGTLDLDKFTKLMVKQEENSLVNNDYLEAFTFFDSEGNNKITAEDI